MNSRDSQVSNFDVERALSAARLAILRGRLGHNEDALKANAKAIEVNRRLIAADYTSYASHLASALNNHADILINLNRFWEALRCAEEAAGLYRALSRTEKGVIPHRALALSNLARCLARLGFNQRALSSAQAAVKTWDKIVAPSSFHLGKKALSLNTLAILLQDNNEAPKAHSIAAQAVNICRELAEAEPSLYTHQLAISLNTLGNTLTEVAQLAKDETKLEGACTVLREALTLYRSLAFSRSQSFDVDVAGVLLNVAGAHLRLRRYSDARSAVIESVKINRVLAKAQPVSSPNLALALHNLALIARDMKLLGEARTAIREAVTLREKFIGEFGEAFAPQLERSRALMRDINLKCFLMPWRVK